MKVIVCDDDPLVRSVVGTIVEERGLTVVGEADDHVGAVELLDRLRPDIAVVDLALRSSTGLDVVRAAWEGGCRVVIFSSYVTPELLRADPEGPVAIEKPHFDRLGDALAQVANRITAAGSDRRRNDRGARQPAPVFAQSVAEAHPGDAIVILEPGPEEQELLDVVTLAAARTTAAQDRVEATARQLRMVLACAGLGGARAVIDRIQATAGVDLGSWSQRVAVVTEELTGVDAFEQIREAGVQT